MSIRLTVCTLALAPLLVAQTPDNTASFRHDPPGLSVSQAPLTRDPIGPPGVSGPIPEKTFKATGPMADTGIFNFDTASPAAHEMMTVGVDGANQLSVVKGSKAVVTCKDFNKDTHVVTGCTLSNPDSLDQAVSVLIEMAMMEQMRADKEYLKGRQDMLNCITAMVQTIVNNRKTVHHKGK